MEKHPLLPHTIDGEQLQAWIQQNAVETFEDQQKVIYDADTLNGFARQSSGCGAEITDLKTQLKEVTDAVNNGWANDEPLTVVIYPTSGVKALDKLRAELDGKVKTGYISEKRKIYGIPYPEAQEMVYFDAAGQHIAERTRKMSAKEKHDYCGMFIDAYKNDISLGQTAS